MKRLPLGLILAFLGAAPAVAADAEGKIGFVSTERILRDAPAAVRAQKKLEKEFDKRGQDLQNIEKQLQKMQENLEKNGLTMAESERRNKEREFNDLSREFQRKRREFGEDLNQRRNEELAAVIERANKTIKQIAEAEKYDIIFQEAVYFNPRIDITDKVIKALGDAPGK
ncbi:MAG TPA: OmpH family outer membrane protein [Solirubrobacterales bacterium]|nr:OmpH family outer membrane protein [Solirubrobacterales bacterium]